MTSPSEHASHGEARQPTAALGSGGIGWILLLLAVALAARVPTLRVPLDQDAAVYTYTADRWMDGQLPYRDVWDHKAPFVYLIYAGLRWLAPASGAGQWTLWLRLASAGCDAMTLLLVFVAAGWLFRRRAALWGAGLFGVFAAGPLLQYEAFQPEHVMVLGVTGAMLAAMAYAESRRLRHAALCGLLFGIGLAAKQTAAPLGLFVWAWLTWEALRQEGRAAARRVVGHSLLLLGGVVLPWLLFAAYFRWRGAFDDFWFCTYLYNARYAAEDRAGGVLEGAIHLLKSMAPSHAFLWVTATAGLLAAAARRRWRSILIVGGWLGCAFLSCLVTGQASPYYFIQTLPPLAIAGGVTLASLQGSFRDGAALDPRNVLCGLALLGLLAFTAKRELDNYRAAVDPQSGNAVAVKVGNYLRVRTSPEERLYVWGSRPQVYVAADRKNVCPFLYNFSYNQALSETYHFREEKLEAIMAGLREYQPPYIVATEIETLKGFPALAEYLDRHYTLQSPDDFQHQWPTRSKFIPLIRVYRRQDR